MNTPVQALPALESLTLEQKVGQMVMVDFPGYVITDEVRKHLTQIPWSGVILFQKNVKEREQLIALNRDIMTLNPDIPPFISVDQEGGLVNRPDFPDMHLSPGNMALGVIDVVKLAEEVAFISGLEQRELGFHLDYAPVVDVNINPRNPIIGVRSFGEDPQRVARLGKGMIRGFERAGIASCAKHFPGHGDTSFDSHLCLASVEADRERINSVELPPFQMAIDAGVPTMMTAHVIFPAVDESREPATLSKKILTGLLRQEMGFEGVIFTDSMAMKAIVDHYGTGEAAIRTVLAGADVVMMCGTFESQVEAYFAILEAVRKGKIPMDLINQAVRRILNFKDRYVVNPKPIPDVSAEQREKVIREAVTRSVTVLYDNASLFDLNLTGKKTVIFSPDHLYKTMLEEYTDEWSIYPILKESFMNLSQEVYDIDNPTLDFFLEKISPDTEVVLLEVYSRGILSQKLHTVFESVISVVQEQKIKIALIVLSSPYGIPADADAAITAYSFLKPSLQAIADRILN